MSEDRRIISSKCKGQSQGAAQINGKTGWMLGRVTDYFWKHDSEKEIMSQKRQVGLTMWLKIQRKKKVLNHMGHMPFVMDLTAMLLTNPYGPLLLQYTLDIVAGSLTFQVPDNTLIYLNYWCIVQNGGCQKKKNVLVRRWHGSLSMHRLFGSQVWEDAMWNHPQLSCCYCAPARPLLHKP